MHRTNTRNDCEFLFAALAEKHNAVIRKIRELPPWEWGCEFLELEPQVLRFLGTFAKRYPECAAFKTAYTLASALTAYRLDSRKPKTLSEQERATCISTNRNLVDNATGVQPHGIIRSGKSGLTSFAKRKRPDQLRLPPLSRQNNRISDQNHQRRRGLSPRGLYPSRKHDSTKSSDVCIRKTQRPHEALSPFARARSRKRRERRDELVIARLALKIRT